MERIKGILSAVFGAAAWLMLLGMPLAWVGLGCDLAGLVLGWRILRSIGTPETERRWALCGLLSSACAAAVCIVLLKTVSVNLS